VRERERERASNKEKDREKNSSLFFIFPQLASSISRKTSVEKEI
jgi:hypothetical protein